MAPWDWYQSSETKTQNIEAHKEQNSLGPSGEGKTHLYYCNKKVLIPTVCPKKVLQFLSIWAKSRWDPDLDHISIGPRLTETVTLFLGHPVSFEVL